MADGEAGVAGGVLHWGVCGGWLEWGGLRIEVPYMVGGRDPRLLCWSG